MVVRDLKEIHHIKIAYWTVLKWKTLAQIYHEPYVVAQEFLQLMFDCLNYKLPVNVHPPLCTY